MTHKHVFSAVRSATLASLLVLGSGAVLAQNNGAIHVAGAIAAGSCSISTSPVNLGEHYSGDFSSGAGTPTNWVRVPITSQGCSADIVTVHMGFDGAADTDNKGLFAVASTPGSARGLGIQLQTEDGSVTVVPNSTTELVNWTPLATGGIYAMRARYVSTLPSVTPGDANSTVTVMLSYN
ncbi:MAG TPA: fimbrial protein [Dyella sp.]|uniref:fimbrial protein n=1 Tax=Dyella sp. TaxID=1869338 RepID=UPI002C809243|nr:fimbrial protein [Dyella sp.]HUB90523.1 fimbrial protein [Dyella sp.]